MFHSRNMNNKNYRIHEKAFILITSPLYLKKIKHLLFTTGTFKVLQLKFTSFITVFLQILWKNIMSQMSNITLGHPVNFNVESQEQ